MELTTIQDKQAVAVSIREWNRNKSSNLKVQIVHSMPRGRNMLGRVLMEKVARS